MLKDTAKTLFWFIDEERVGIVEKETSEDSTGKMLTEYKSPTISIGMGLRIRYKANYRPVSKIDEDLDGYSNLHESLHPALVCYVKSRLYEDAGDMEMREFFMREFKRQLEKGESSKKRGPYIVQGFKEMR